MVSASDGGKNVQTHVGLARCLVRGVVTAWVVLAIEFVVAMAAQRAQLASVWELQHGLWGLLPAWLLTAALPGLFGGACAYCAVRGVERKGRFGLAACGALFGFLVGFGVGGGRHLAATGVRVGFAMLVATLVALAWFVLAPWLSRGLDWLSRSPRARTSFAAALAALLLAIELANRFVLVRLYPAFHAGLSVLLVVVACVGGAAWWLSSPSEYGSRAKRLTAQLAVPVLLVLSALLLGPNARSVAGFDNFRLVLLEHAPTLAWGVKLAARVAPPPAPTCQSAECGDVATSQSGGLDWAGRDIVLISVDALRADHLGAYGYARKTTPELDALAREGVVFEAAYAATPHTSYSVTSLMTGKYMRPLLLQGAGEDSDTWAGLLRTYGYKTAAFYPPAVFFIDTSRFEHFEKSRLDFEYSKVEFAEGELRASQVRSFLDGERGSTKPLFLWMHLFSPHEPYEAHEGLDFGPRDVDRYDSEIASADRTLGAVVRMVREKSPNAVVIITADHGEEFGEHGGRYHGTSVYEEQVRVPLIVVAPGSVAPGRVQVPVQTIDVLPTVLSALAVPRPARIRGRDLGPLLAKRPPLDEGLALAETDEQALLAEGSFRLVCERRVGACRLYDLRADASQSRDVSGADAPRFERMRQRLRALGASHGEFEARGLRAEGKGWPPPILRGISGDADAAPELAELLDDADVGIRRKAAELLFELRRPETAPALRLALTRDEDTEVRRWAALGLTRLGEGAPLVYELVGGTDKTFRRLAALALAETGDGRGEEDLIAWWRDPASRDFERSRQILFALARLRAKDAMPALVQSLGDVRLRPDIARTLAAIGDDDALGPLVVALRKERYQSARSALVDAIVSLGGEDELVAPLVKFLGVPDPLKDGVDAARRARILDQIGGPKDAQLASLKRLANSGVDVDLMVPPGGNGTGVRLIVRARLEGEGEGKIYVQKAQSGGRNRSKELEVSARNLPTIDTSKAIVLTVPPGDSKAREIAAIVPSDWKAGPARQLSLSVFADSRVRIEALAAVPLADELPPPPPEPWKPAAAQNE